MTSQKFIPGEGVRPGLPIWVISSRNVCLPATCTEIIGSRVLFEYLDGKPGAVHIQESAVRLVNMPEENVDTSIGD